VSYGAHPIREQLLVVAILMLEVMLAKQQAFRPDRLCYHDHSAFELCGLERVSNLLDDT